MEDGNTDRSDNVVAKRRRYIEWKRFPAAVAMMEHVFNHSTHYPEGGVLDRLAASINQKIASGSGADIVVGPKKILTWFSNRRKREVRKRQLATADAEWAQQNNRNTKRKLGTQPVAVQATALQWSKKKAKSPPNVGTMTADT